MGDLEIEAMSAIAAALSELDDDGRRRVLRWAADRYSVSLLLSNPIRQTDGPSVYDGAERTDGVTDEEIAEEAPRFEHFAELFAKAQPKTDADKALVAAYWRQAIEGQDTWKSGELQKDLKNLGHAAGNITDAMTSNIRKKPQRIIQIQKSGNSRQAHKIYKVTHEGLVYVQGMLSREGS